MVTSGDGIRQDDTKHDADFPQCWGLRYAVFRQIGPIDY